VAEGVGTQLFQTDQRVNTSRQLLDIVYGPAEAESGADHYLVNRALYLSIADKLDDSLRGHPARMAMLSVIARYIFWKRKSVQVSSNFESYKRTILATHPGQACFHEIETFLKLLDIRCAPEAFYNAVLLKLEVVTEQFYVLRDPVYFDLRKQFRHIEHCDSALDLLVLGLFYGRAKHTQRNLIRTLFIAVLIALSVAIWNRYG
jgi:hypothetical protein